MAISLQYYLGYCLTPISSSYHPLEVSKGGLSSRMHYLYLAISAIARDVVESAWLGGYLMWGVHQSIVLSILMFSRLMRNQSIKGSHTGLTLSTTYIIIVWIFESIIGPSQYRMVINCADNKACHIFPFIQDISANTEEL